MFSSYSQRIAAGEIARIVGNSIQVDEGIDKELRKQVDTVINGCGRVHKDRAQEVLRCLGLNIGFLYKDQGAFLKGLAALRQKNPKLADYLQEVRANWSERLILCRNRLEHQGWILPKVMIHEECGFLRTLEPVIDGQPVTEFVTQMLDRVCCFVEELCAFGLQAHMPNGISITEIPLNDRKPEFKERFQLALVGGGMSIWSISYHERKFEDA